MQNRIYITTNWEGKTTVEMEDIWTSIHTTQVPKIKRAGNGFVITFQDGQQIKLDNMKALKELMYVTALMYHNMTRRPQSLSDTYSISP